MKQFHDNLQFILENGSWKTNRTQYSSLMVPGLTMRFDLRKGFPAVTTKKLAFKSVIGELVGFLRALRNAADFRALGCKVWDQNANANVQWLANPFRKGDDDLGDVYGAMWREWPAYKLIPYYDASVPDYADHALVQAARAAGYERLGSAYLPTSTGTMETAQCGHLMYKSIDMLGDCVRNIILNPDDRRILFHAWNPAKLDEMALPPCHLLYHFLPNKDTKELALCMTQRSADYFLGIPFNIAESALLLHIVARLTGYTPTWLTITTNDSHIYENAIDATKELLTREAYPLPTLHISDTFLTYDELVSAATAAGDLPEGIQERTVKLAIDSLQWLNPEWFTIPDYRCHETIKVDMAV